MLHLFPPSGLDIFGNAEALYHLDSRRAVHFVRWPPAPPAVAVPRLLPGIAFKC